MPLLAVWCLATNAAAQTAPSAAPSGGTTAGTDDQAAAKELAKKHYDEGVAAFEAGRNKDAVDLLLAADRAMHSPAFSYNIAVAYDAMGDTPSALRYFRAYLRELPEASDRQEVEKRVSVLETALEERGIQQLTVLSTPDGGTVLVDGKPLGVTPWTGELNPGRHHVSVQLRGYADADQVADLAAHRAIDLTFTLTPSESPRPAASLPQAPPPDSDPGGSRIRPWTWGALGAGVVLLGAAEIFDIQKRNAKDEAERAPQVDWVAKVQAADQKRDTALMLASVGGAVAITGAVLLVLDLTRTPPPVAVGVSASSAVVTGGGTF